MLSVILPRLRLAGQGQCSLFGKGRPKKTNASGLTSFHYSVIKACVNSLINGFERKLVGKKKTQYIKSCLPDIQTSNKLMLLILNYNQHCSKLDSLQTKHNVTLTQFNHIYTYVAGYQPKT